MDGRDTIRFINGFRANHAAAFHAVVGILMLLWSIAPLLRREAGSGHTPGNFFRNIADLWHRDRRRGLIGLIGLVLFGWAAWVAYRVYPENRAQRPSQAVWQHQRPGHQHGKADHRPRELAPPSPCVALGSSYPRSATTPDD